MEMNQQQSQRANSSRPYTHGSFQLKLELFEQFIKDFTYVDEELNPEERRQILQDRLTNGEMGIMTCLVLISNLLSLEVGNLVFEG